MHTLGHVEIFPQKTLTLPPYTTTNTVFYGRNNFIIIDPATANPDEQAVLAARIQERLDLGHKLLGLFLTHHHGDHIGAAVFLQQKFNIAIWGHLNTKKYLAFVSNFLEDRQIINLDNLLIQILFTPGHADSHIVFYAPKEQILIAGDMITDKGTTLIPPLTGSLSLYLESLEFILSLNIKIIIPAHGQVINNNPGEFLSKALKHRYERIRAIYNILENSKISLDNNYITNLVYSNLDNSIKYFAELSVESSLGWLIEKKLVQKIDNKYKISNL